MNCHVGGKGDKSRVIKSRKRKAAKLSAVKSWHLDDTEAPSPNTDQYQPVKWSLLKVHNTCLWKVVTDSLYSNHMINCHLNEWGDEVKNAQFPRGADFVPLRMYTQFQYYLIKIICASFYIPNEFHCYDDIKNTMIASIWFLFWSCRCLYFVQLTFLCGLQSIAAHRDHFFRRLSVRPSVPPYLCLSGSHTFMVVILSW